MAKNKTTNFTVIVPTYTGEEYLPACFDSILDQKLKKAGDVFDTVVVIDGPNANIQKITQAYKAKFQEKSIGFKVHQLPTNQGRFQARLKGAQLARAQQLLFVDDRITFENDYFATVLNSGESVLLPNVLEAEAKNKINRCLYLLRRLVYGKAKFGASFDSFFIDKKNFEKSPKGTTSLWIAKSDFLDACEAIASSAANRHVNDDTKLFRHLIDSDKKIYKSSEAKIYYNPRSSAWSEVEHIYHRGPRFVDYYIRPGTRFFVPLMLLIVLLLLLIFAIIFEPKLTGWILAAILAGDALLTAVAAQKLSDAMLFFFYPVIVISFTLGVVKGLISKLLA